MLSKEIANAINDQINEEFYAWYQYLQMAAWSESSDFPGFAKWLRQQAAEEQGHAMRLFDFLLDWGGEVSLKPIKAPDRDFKSLTDVFERALASEQHVNKLVNRLYEQAFEEKAYAAHLQFQWFVNEQVEEVKTAEYIVSQLRLAKDESAALLMLDREMGQRTAAE